ncbi:MAG: RidA family protein [Burkholderiaceae bacterium]
MNRTPVNPWQWSLHVGYNQGEILEGSKRQLNCAGQTAVDSEGKPQHPNDMRAQLNLALDNLEAVLNGAKMSFADLTRLSIYTTDTEEAMKHFDLMGMRLGAVGATPPTTLLGVSSLAFPELMIELEATAAD